MPSHPAYQRQAWLLRYLEARRGRPVPFETLRAAVEAAGFMTDFEREYLLRNWQRDRRQLEAKFNLSIENQRGVGYYLAADAPAPDSTALRLAEALALNDFLQLPAALQPYVQPEARRAQGLEHLRPLLRAAQGRRVVEFEYQKYWEDEAETRTVGPLLLKEFRGRWYVLGVMVWSGRLACYGLDRLRSLRETGDAFELPAGFEAAGYYADAFGITRPHDAEPQEVVLRFEPVQGRYVLGYPLHHSQRVLVDDEAEIRLSLRVYLTHELYMELLSYGDQVEVLAPERLREWLQQGHRAAAG